MYVKSLTMKGFKSFASATHVRLEPGITCIVGPNGSGKSNVVDALAWVMGEQGAKSLRGGKMEDVIFAGTAGRPPLGRAEVTLTIDNSDGALPIDYTEVTIARTMFRSGGSEYAINGTSCRLLDIQELLSDSGIGREMHVIVGQGQLDAVLRATPEERRGFIEEAAGVLKHRKRKERALRKLETMEANLTRITDLTGEIRRQLGPLGRQAETARKAAVIQADARDARLRLLADDLVLLTSTLEQEVADETALIARRTEVEEQLAGVGGRVGALDAAAEAARPELLRAQDRWYALARLTERLTATGSLAAERVRLLRQDLADEGGDGPGPGTGRDPEELRRQAADLLAQHEALVVEIADATAALQTAVAERGDLERAYAAEQQRLARVARAVADRREGLARLAGQVAAKASRVEAAEGEIGRMRENVEQARVRAGAAEREFAALESSIAVEEAGEEGLDEGYEAAAAALDGLEAEVEHLLETERAAERDRQSGAARVEALEMSLRRKDGAAALLAAQDTRHEISGSVATLLQVDAGHEAAVAAALGWAGDALAVPTQQAASAALATLRADDAGRAGLLVAETAPAVDAATWPALPAGARWAGEVVHCPDTMRPAVDRLLERVAIVTDVAAATALVGRGDGVTAVTADGDVFAPGWARGGSSAAPSLIEIQAAVDTAREQVTEATGRGERARFALAAARARAADAGEAVEVALDRLHDSDAKMSAVAERLGALGVAVRTARAEAERTERSIATAEAALAADRTEHLALSERLSAAEAQPDAAADDVSPAERDRLDRATVAARAQETELRLALRTREERGRALLERAASLEQAAVAELQSRARQAARRERRRHEAQVAAAVHTGATYAVGRPGPGRRAGRRPAASRPRRLAPPATPSSPCCAAGCPGCRTSCGSSPTPCTGTRWREPSSGCASSSSRRAPWRSWAPTRPRWSRSSARTSLSRCPSDAASGEAPAPEPSLRTRGAGEAAAGGGAQAGGPRPGQPARAGGVHGAGGAAYVPHHPARGPAALQARPARHRPRGRRAGRAGLHRGLPRCRRAVRARLRAAVPRWGGPAGADRPRAHADHRPRRRGPAAGQEGQAAVAAVRRGAVPRRGGTARGHLPGPALAVLHPRRGRGGARRRQPRPAHRAAWRSCATPASSSSSRTRRRRCRSPTRSTA